MNILRFFNVKRHSSLGSMKGYFEIILLVTAIKYWVNGFNGLPRLEMHVCIDSWEMYIVYHLPVEDGNQ